MTTNHPQKYTEMELASYKKSLTTIREVVFTVGFNRSGSSLIGDLMTAHPNIIMSNEAGVIRRYTEGEFDSRESLFTCMIENNIEKKRKNFMPDQHRHDRAIEVIGDKHSSNNTMSLMKKDFNTLGKLESLIKLPIKFIFTVRNPYDMISSMVNNIPDWEISTDEKINDAFLYFLGCSKKNSELINLVSANRIFMLKHEDFIADPQQRMAGICDFLGVTKPLDYLANCAEATYKVPKKSRYKIDWNKEHEEHIDAMIEKYSFFNGYNQDV